MVCMRWKEAEIMMVMSYLDNLGIRVEPTGAFGCSRNWIIAPSINDRIGCVLSGGNFDEEEYKKCVFQGRKNIIDNDF